MRILKDNEPVASTISKIINSAGFKQAYVAEKAGYSEATFSAMLNGRKIIRPCDIPKIANALNVRPDKLFNISN